MQKAFVSALPKITVAQQVAELTAAGLTDKETYVNGRGSESLSACIASLRGQPGEIVIAADLRIFGESRKAILDTLAMLERLQITVRDVAHKETSQPAMMDRALTALANYSKWKGDSKKQAKNGRQGGKARGLIAALKRAEKMPDDAVRRLTCSLGETVTWKLIAHVTGLSTATLRRHYVEE